MTIEIWLGIALLFSLGFNFILLWFAIRQSQSLLYISENLGDLIEIIANYKEHLRKVYSLEMFYGDETLKHLMDHTVAVVSMLQEDYSEVTSITEPLEIIFEEGIEIEETEEQEEKRQDVFYAGSRRRDP